MDMDKNEPYFRNAQVSWFYRFLLIIICFSGCTRQAIFTSVLDDPPSTLSIASPSQVRSSTFNRIINTDPDTSWVLMIRTLVPSALIVKMKEGEHLVSFIKIDGFYHESKMYFAEFPMVAYLEAYDDSSTKVYVQPAAQSYQMPSRIALKESYLQAQDTKINEFLDRLSSEIEGKSRWPWLWENKQKTDTK